MSKRKTSKKGGSWIFVILVVLLLLGFAYYYFSSKDSKNNDANKTNNTTEEKTYTKAEVLSMLKGIWGYCYNDDGADICYSLRVDNTADENNFGYGRYGTDAGIYGTIKSVKLVANTVYKIEVFTEGCHSDECLYDNDDTTNEITIDLKDIKNKKISVDRGDRSDIFEYIAEDYDSSESYFMDKLHH